jgi:hypothetical protein
MHHSGAVQQHGKLATYATLATAGELYVRVITELSH